MDAPYTVLARRFRPQTFSEVVGQERIAQALRNAIQAGRVAHAYLFTGARGVGKTSMARILAKALNCPNAVDGIPCNQCDICRSISAGHDMDVLEIDGASNRGIDDIRSLRANVGVKSMRTRTKIYIIDEVHMLTKEAFNALLKTLEEPPPNVKFVFCTTEPNKLPDTILSRCQRFDFGTIETANIVSRLRQLAEAEGVDVDEGALELVARRAAGSMRDSQSLFDQLLAFGEQHVGVEDVHRLLGTASDERLVELVEALVERRRDEALRLFAQALVEGVQLEALTDQLLAYVRDLMVLACGAAGVSLQGVSESTRPRLESQAKRWGLQTAVAALQILAEAKGRMRGVTYGRTLAELALVRVSLLTELDRLDDLLQAVRSAPAGRAELPRPAASGALRAPESERLSVPPPQKKSEPAPDEPGPAAAADPVPLPSVEFRPGNERELWAEVLSVITDMLKDHVQAVRDVAIRAPNHLELTFPASYDFSRRYCARAEVLTRLQGIVRQLTGQSVQIVLRGDDATSEPATVPRPAARRDTARRPLDSIKDEFVQEAMAVFGATVAKVDGLHVPAPADEDEQ